MCWMVGRHLLLWVGAVLKGAREQLNAAHREHDENEDAHGAHVARLSNGRRQGRHHQLSPPPNKVSPQVRRGGYRRGGGVPETEFPIF